MPSPDRSAELAATEPRLSQFLATRTPDAAGSAVEFTFNNVGQISSARVTTNDTHEAARISQFIETLNAGVTTRLVNSKNANYR
jgi:hypothetical protein